MNLSCPCGSCEIHVTEYTHNMKSFKKKRMKAGAVIVDPRFNRIILVQSRGNLWGFPKGRRDNQEKDITCALREFEEETGYNKHDIKLITNIVPYEEIFTGSNFKSYKHKYFIAYSNKDIIPIKPFQVNEVSDMKWVPFSEAIELFRPYNKERIIILKYIRRITDG